MRTLIPCFVRTCFVVVNWQLLNMAWLLLEEPDTLLRRPSQVHFMGLASGLLQQWKPTTSATSATPGAGAPLDSV